ncbi:hypothetical protein ACGFX4_08955 [Kitasatospora sp. NPDC048365]|uniref:hypothetical protein n=1 Tax=Kitasatospora sp. NPDC048365 TaxID=3364050 RepID=UPI003724611D
MDETDWPIPGWRHSERLRNFYSWPFTPSGISDIEAYRAAATDGSEYAGLVRESLEHLLDRRPLSTTDWLHRTGFQFYSEDELYGYLRQVYAFFYEDGGHPRAPDPGRQVPAEFFGAPLPSVELPEELELLNGPEPHFPRWHAQYADDAAANQAMVALRVAAREQRDLAPVLSFAQVYGAGEAALGQAVATGTYDGVELALGPDGLAKAVYHPDGRGRLVNSLFWPTPVGAVDPTTVPLAELGLDVPGVDRRFVNFCSGWLSAEAEDQLWELGRSFADAWPDYRATVGAGLRQLVRRPVDVERWYGLTSVRFDGERELACYLAEVEAYLFGSRS